MLLHPPRVLHVVAGVAVHAERERRWLRRVIVGRNTELEGLPRAVDGREVGPLGHAAELAEHARVGEDAFGPLAEPRLVLTRLLGVFSEALVGVRGAKLQVADPAVIRG